MFTADDKKALSTFLGQETDVLDVDIYSYMLNGMMTDLTVTKVSCIPVTELQKSNDLFIDTSNMNITIGIADMAIFNIPKPCL